MKYVATGAFIFAAVCVSASAGVVKHVAKPAYVATRETAEALSFPLRHPKRAAKATSKAAKKTSRAAKKSARKAAKGAKALAW